MKQTKATPEYKVQHVPINSIKSNADNPRIIKDDKFKKLVKSISEFPQMLELRPIIVDSDMVILGGNMRHKAAMECGLEIVPIVIAEDLTEEQKKEFIIKDNVGFGEWDWELLANDWDADLLVEWGLDVETSFNKIDAADIEEGAEVVLDQAVQLLPKREYVVIMCNHENDEWEELKELLKLKIVKRGGCKLGSAFEVHKGINRVVYARDFINTFRHSQ